MPLEWSEPRPPTKGVSPYDHAEAQTPLGVIRLEWKSWKDYDSPTFTMPWGEHLVCDDIEDAKLVAQAKWNAMVKSLAPFCSQ